MPEIPQSRNIIQDAFTMVKMKEFAEKRKFCSTERNRLALKLSRTISHANTPEKSQRKGLKNSQNMLKLPKSPKKFHFSFSRSKSPKRKKIVKTQKRESRNLRLNKVTNFTDLSQDPCLICLKIPSGRVKKKSFKNGMSKQGVNPLAHLSPVKDVSTFLSPPCEFIDLQVLTQCRVSHGVT
ncbi:unnamed protein product [Moneuplotes crassus]|uniref:Uncharacterized protein n=1 Tax=Euplotes crassus TaxID=5936 RepID=A0AAD1XEC3_EUPCR|nr:unnamed protein product [Moneuplotes crassus]